MFYIAAKKKGSNKATANAPIDEIMKYLFSVSKETLINMLNGLFKQNFSVDNATVIQTNSEFVDENFDITRGDLFYLILDDKSKQYSLHIELQTRPDGYMTIRLLSYDIKKAAEMQQLGNAKRYILPKSIVIHVEKGENIPDCYETEIVDVKDDGSEEIIHRSVPIIKYWKLTDKELIEKKLYPLLPLQIFLLRGELKRLAKEQDSEDKNKLIQDIKNLTEKIIIEVKKLAEEGKINKGDDDRIITALARLIKYLTTQYSFDEKLNQEVSTMIKSVFTTLKEEGISEGKVKGKIEGKTEMAEEMILNNEPLEKILKYSKLTEKKIRQLAKKLSKDLIL